MLELFRESDGRELRRILDLGCGTGSHAVVFAQRGLEVVGVDRSAEMIKVARQKATQLPPSQRPEFVTADIRDARLDQKFDAVVMMFAVLGYQHSNADVLATLATAHLHLETGGLLAFDVWYGPAVLSEKPSDRVQVSEGNARKVIRTASAKLEPRDHLCDVDYRVWVVEHGSLLEETSERHIMRYFFPLELELLLTNSGFSLVRLGSFADFDAEPDMTTWNVLALARAV